MEGAKYFGNSEKQQCMRDATNTDKDKTTCQPIKANIPHVNVLVGGYKCRGMIDSGSTVTMISTGLLERIPELKAKMKPTTFTFFGVGENSMKY
jgi:hypothetical protein